jgi:hypothetical protein
MVKTITAPVDRHCDRFEGQLVRPGMITPGYLIDEGDVDVLRPDGQPLLRVRRGVISDELADRAFGALEGAAIPSSNRGIAGGRKLNLAELDETTKAKLAANELKIADDGRIVPNRTGKPWLGQKWLAKVLAGKVAGHRPVRSGVAGNVDRSRRFPYCRQTVWTAKHRDKWQSAIGYIQRVSSLVKQHWPERWEAQKAACDQTAAGWVIPNTIFTTLTVNKNWATAIHKDAGDLAEGIGVLTCLKQGRPYKGGQLVFPQFGVAVDWGNNDLLLADVHQWHGNLPIRGLPGSWVRLSVVFYYREHMRQCGLPAQELARAKTGIKTTIDKGAPNDIDRLRSEP